MNVRVSRIAYIKSVGELIQMIESDEDYMALQIDPRFVQLKQQHHEMCLVCTKPTAPKRKGPTKAMKAVTAMYEKDVKMFSARNEQT